MSDEKQKPEFLYNQIYRSGLGERFYFVRKVRVHRRADNPSRGIWIAMGNKVDVTESLQPYLQKKYRIKERP